MVGRLLVQRPTGEPVVLPTRKCGGVLAMLALSPDLQLPRRVVAEELWAESMPSQQTANLRQAVAGLRRALGDDSPFHAGRDRLWLDGSRVVVQPFAEPSSVVPEMTEPWFEAFRQARALPPVEPWTPLEALLGWAAEHEPARAAEILRACHTLAEGLNPHQLLPVARAARRATRPDDPLHGWAVAMEGLAQFMLGSTPAAASCFVAAVEHARVHRDAALFGLAAFYDSMTRLTAENLPGGVKWLRAAVGEGPRAYTKELWARLLHGQSLYLIHWGQVDEGLTGMRRAAEVASSLGASFEHQYALANMAWLAAGSANVRVAEHALEQYRQSSAEAPQRIRLTAELGQGALDADRERLTGVLEEASDHGLIGFVAYAYEQLALLELRDGRSASADSLVQQAKEVRRTLSSRYTRWDRARLGPLIVP